MNLFYLIGIPGSGKTTLFNALFNHLNYRTIEYPFMHTLYMTEQALIQLGHKQREHYRGTDTLPFNAQPKVLRWLSARVTDELTVVGEGDRLANRSFFDSLDQWGIELTVAYLNTPPDWAATRRQQRGSNQSPTWIRSRETKIRNLVQAAFVTPGWELDGRKPIDQLVLDLKRYPPFAEL